MIPRSWACGAEKVRDILNRAFENSATVLSRDDDLVEVNHDGNRIRFQVIFKNPNETKRVDRPLSNPAEVALETLILIGVPVIQSPDMVDILEIEGMLLDPYLVIEKGKVL